METQSFLGEDIATREGNTQKGVSGEGVLLHKFLAVTPRSISVGRCVRTLRGLWLGSPRCDLRHFFLCDRAGCQKCLFLGSASNNFESKSLAKGKSSTFASLASFVSSLQLANLLIASKSKRLSSRSTGKSGDAAHNWYRRTPNDQISIARVARTSSSLC